MPDDVLVGLTGLAAVLELAGGVMMAASALGLASAATAAQVLLAFMVPTTIIMHKPAAGDDNSAIQLLKNLALIGGLLAVVAGTSAATTKAKSS